MTHTDIKNNHWLERYLPASFLPYVHLMRLDRPIGSWLLLLPGWWAIIMAAGGVRVFNAFDLKMFVFFGIGAVVMRGAGCVINDLWDRDLDKKVERTRVRPLASGAISIKQALVFLAVLLLIGLAILIQMTPVTIMLGFLTIPLIVSYPLMKRITWWPQIVLGITFNFGALMGWAAITDVVALPAFLLYCGGIFWTLGYDTIYAHQDKEDDVMVGIKSTALKFGATSRRWVAGFYAAAMVCFTAAFVLADTGLVSLLLLILPAIHLAWQVKMWDMDDQSSSLRFFKSNRDFGLLLLLAAMV